MNETYPIKVWLEASVSSTLQNLISESSSFVLLPEPDEAAFIIYEKDTPSYITGTKEYQTWPEKCVAVTETDLPSYFLPGCYASNKKSYLGKKRSITIPFLISQYYGSNPFIEAIDTDFQFRYLYAFRGGSTSWVRKRLFKMALNKADVLIENSSNYHHWNGEASYIEEKSRQQKEYADLLNESLFFLCPRGAGVSSIRLFEVMQAGKIPVILSDDWIPVPDIAWNQFAVFIPENKLSQIDSTIRSYQSEGKERGLTARKVWEKHCAPTVAAAQLADALKQLQNQMSPQYEKWIHTIYPFFYATNQMKQTGRHWAKRAILKFFSLTGLKFSYALNRPIDEQLKKKSSK